MVTLFSHNLQGSKTNQDLWRRKIIGVADNFSSRIPLGALALVVFYGVTLGLFGSQLFCFRKGSFPLAVRYWTDGRVWLAAKKPPTALTSHVFPHQEANQSTYYPKRSSVLTALSRICDCPQPSPMRISRLLLRFQAHTHSTNSASNMHVTYWPPHAASSNSYDRWCYRLSPSFSHHTQSPRPNASTILALPHSRHLLNVLPTSLNIIFSIMTRTVVTCPSPHRSITWVTSAWNLPAASSANHIAKDGCCKGGGAARRLSMCTGL